jgi:hypothetical protein
LSKKYKKNSAKFQFSHKIFIFGLSRSVNGGFR